MLSRPAARRLSTPYCRLQKEAEALRAKLTPQYLEWALIQAIGNNTKVGPTPPLGNVGSCSPHLFYSVHTKPHCVASYAPRTQAALQRVSCTHCCKWCQCADTGRAGARRVALSPCCSYAPPHAQRCQEAPLNTHVSATPSRCPHGAFAVLHRLCLHRALAAPRAPVPHVCRSSTATGCPP